MKYTNIDAYLRQMNAAQKLILQASDKILNQTILNLYRKIVEYTPIGNPVLWKYPAHKDYVPGTLKASWHISYNGQRRDANTGRFISSASIIGKGGLELSAYSANKTVAIYNTQPYAQRVEYGWSTQAPQGMMRRAVAEWKPILDEAAKQWKL